MAKCSVAQLHNPRHHMILDLPKPSRILLLYANSGIMIWSQIQLRGKSCEVVFWVTFYTECELMRMQEAVVY